MAWDGLHCGDDAGGGGDGCGPRRLRRRNGCTESFGEGKQGRWRGVEGVGGVGRGWGGAGVVLYVGREGEDFQNKAPVVDSP